MEINKFGFLVASQWDSTVLQKAYEGDMMIKWYGYGNVFKYFDWPQIQNGEFQQSDFEGKIVVLGFMGEKIGACSAHDLFYSPLNHKMVGRSLPDIHAVEVHANIIKMIIDKDFIFRTKTTDYLFNFTFILLLTILLFWLQNKFSKQYSVLSKIALLIFIDFLVLGTIGIFYWTNGEIKFLIGDGLFVMVFIPDTYEFLESNIFNKIK